ncbi:MAG: hypothetical protein ABSG65_07190 [Bryobacteraceae bacterium]|jgi:hypothetical protein
MTYQLTLIGCDGVVMASDRSESYATQHSAVDIKSLVTKINVAGPFAWMYSGADLGSFCSKALKPIIENRVPNSDEEAVAALAESERAGYELWRQAQGWNGPSWIIMTCAQTKTIWRSRVVQGNNIEQIHAGVHVSGLAPNLASFFPQSVYQASMNVEQLAVLAAFTIECGRDLDSAHIDGLDIAVYRDEAAKFEFVNVAPYLERAHSIDAAMRDLFHSPRS